MDFAFLFITKLVYEQLKARGGLFDLLSIGTRKLKARTHPFVSGIRKRILKNWLTMRMSNFSFSDDFWDRKIQSSIFQDQIGSIVLFFPRLCLNPFSRNLHLRLSVSVLSMAHYGFIVWCFCWNFCLLGCFGCFWVPFLENSTFNKASLLSQWLTMVFVVWWVWWNILQIKLAFTSLIEISFLFPQLCTRFVWRVLALMFERI